MINYTEDINGVIKYSTVKGDLDEVEIINTLDKSEYKKIIILGLGITEEFNAIMLLNTLGKAIRNLKQTILKIWIYLITFEDFGYKIVKTFELALYNFNGIKKRCRE